MEVVCPSVHVGRNIDMNLGFMFPEWEREQYGLEHILMETGETYVVNY